MSKQIEAETLREWLDAHQPVTVLDIRSDEDRAQWAIPGSLHLNAYEALRAGQPGVLADAPSRLIGLSSRCATLAASARRPPRCSPTGASTHGRSPAE